MYHVQFCGKGYQQVAHYGNIYAQTDKPHYYAGEQVTGNIYLMLKQPYPGYDVYLKLKGKERTLIIWFEQVDDGNGGVYEVERIERQEASCLYEKVIVHAFPRGQYLLAGQYQFPFSFKLPDNIPGTFHQHEHNLSASITYTVEAYFEPVDSFVPKLKYKHRFTVREPVRHAIQQVNATSTTEVVCCSGCCPCKSYGSVEVKVSFEKDTYCPSDEARSIIQVDNSRCSASVNSIAFDLRQSLNVRANFREENRQHILASNSVPGAGAGQITEPRPDSIILPPAPDIKIIFLKGHEHLKNKEAYLNRTINSTTNGILIKSYFYLEARAYTDGCLANVPTTPIPCQIVYPDYGFSAVQLPPNWKPQVLSTFNFAPSMNANYGVKSQPNTNLMPGGMIQGNTMGINANSGMLQPSSMAIQQVGYLGAQQLQQQQLQQQQLQQQQLQQQQLQQPQPQQQQPQLLQMQQVQLQQPQPQQLQPQQIQLQQSQPQQLQPQQQQPQQQQQQQQQRLQQQQ